MCLDEKGLLVHSSGRGLYGYNLTNGAAFKVAITDSVVSALDVDSVAGHVYWIDGTRMRRAMLNGNDTLFAEPQDLCEVNNASGIAFDWIAGSVNNTLGPPKCTNCNRLLAVKHILTERTSYGQTRHQYYSFDLLDLCLVAPSGT